MWGMRNTTTKRIRARILKAKHNKNTTAALMGTARRSNSLSQKTWPWTMANKRANYNESAENNGNTCVNSKVGIRGKESMGAILISLMKTRILATLPRLRTSKDRLSTPRSPKSPAETIILLPCTTGMSTSLIKVLAWDRRTSCPEQTTNTITRVSTVKAESGQIRAVAWFVKRGAQAEEGTRKGSRTMTFLWRGIFQSMPTIEMETVTKHWKSTSIWTVRMQLRHRKEIGTKVKAYWDMDMQARIILMALRNPVRIRGSRLCDRHPILSVWRCQVIWWPPWDSLITSCSIHHSRTLNNSKSTSFSNNSKTSSKSSYRCNFSNDNSINKTRLLCSNSKWINSNMGSSSTTRTSPIWCRQAR